MMNTFNLRLAVIILACFSVPTLHGQTTTTWNNGGGDQLWNDSANWSSGVPNSNGSTAVLIGSAQPTGGIIGVNTTGTADIASLTFTSTGLTGGVTLEAASSQTLQVNGAITNNSSYNQFLSLGVTAGANAAYTGGSGLTFNQLTVGTDDITTSGNILVNDLVLTINSASSFGQFGGFTGTGTTPKINVIGTYTGTAGNSFQLITGSFSGATLGTLPTLSAGLSWNTSLFAADGTISVVPEPSPLNLLFLGLGLMAFAKVVLKPRVLRFGDVRS